MEAFAPVVIFLALFAFLAWREWLDHKYPEKDDD